MQFFEKLGHKMQEKKFVKLLFLLYLEVVD